MSKTTVILNLLLFILMLSCSGSDDSSTTFSLVKSQTGLSNRLDIVYEEDLLGEVSYIVSSTDQGINSVSGFNSSTLTKTSETATSDGLLFNNYITISSLNSDTQYYVYIKYNNTVHALSETTYPASNAGREAVTGTIYGSVSDSTTSYDYTITFPADYGSTSAKWPFLLAMKVGSFTGKPNFPCIVFYIDVYSGSTTDTTEINNIKSTIKTFIEDTSNNIDLDRIYLIGYSAGGNAAFLIANDDTSTEYDVRALMVEGARNWISNYCNNLADTHIWLFYGETDSERTAIASLPLIIDALPDGNGEHVETIMPGYGHTIAPVVDSPHAIKWLLDK